MAKDSNIAIDQDSAVLTMAEIRSETEQEMIHAACDFFQTLLDMMNAADSDFDKLDDNYAQEKIK